MVIITNILMATGFIAILLSWFFAKRKKENELSKNMFETKSFFIGIIILIIGIIVKIVV